jgi:mono/diheme cytochrome c family protein
MSVRFLFLVVFLGVVGCDLPGQPLPEDKPIPSNEITDFHVLYKNNCSGCHGADGKLGPAPPLNNPIYLALVSEKDIEHIITNGRHGTPMPAFGRSAGGSLTDKQVTILAEDLKSNWKYVKDSKNLPPYALPATKGLVKQGGEAFARACAVCHGNDGKGIKGKAGAINDPDFLALISDQALRRYIITGRPDLGMPDYASKDGRGDNFKPLTDSEITDLTAFLAAWRQGSTAK